MEPATVIDQRYHVVAPIGAGGCGTVFEVIDLEHSSRCALKLALAEPEASLAVRNERLAAEAVRLQRICSPHVTGYIAHGVWESRSYLVTTLGNRGALGTRFRNGLAGDPWTTAKLATAIAHGLDACHQAGYVHRDVEPGNILIEQVAQVPHQADAAQNQAALFAHDERVVLADLGVAAAIGSADHLEDPVRGTRLYASPEQAAYRQASLPSSDIYGATAVIVSALAASLPPPLEQVADLVAQLRPAWAAFVAKGMAPLPTQRHQDVWVWHDDLLNAINTDLLEAGHDAIATASPSV